MKHSLIVVNPGHFHAALTLRERHPLLSNDVSVYAEDGPELEKFLEIVGSFNRRSANPTAWNLNVYRGSDYLEALLRDPPGDIAILAGKNDSKLSSMSRLHQAGIHVLGDKTWLIDSSELDLLKPLTSSAPLAMDIMTERFEIATRLQQGLAQQPEVFGAFRDSSDGPSVYFRSVHHLFKEVNGAPLVRPPWYFDTAVQGEGITDVSTHLADLAQWMIGCEEGADYARDIVLTSARQWPTAIPIEIFSRITGMNSYPKGAKRHVQAGVLEYPCNARIDYRLRGVPVALDIIWDLAIPVGGGDTHYGIVRGERADIIVDQGPDTGFETRLRIFPVESDARYEHVLSDALRANQETCPGSAYRACAIGAEESHPVAVPAGRTGYEIIIPAALHQGHEARFAQVLNEFLVYVDAGSWPQHVSQELVAKYTLLAKARELSQR